MRITRLNLFMALLALLIFLSGCNSSGAATGEKEKERLRGVKVIKIKNGSSGIKEKFPALIKPGKEAKVSFRIGGPLDSFSLETGERVEKGEVIARVDERDYLVKINGINAKLSAAKARLKDAKLQFARYKSLLDENAAPKAEFDRVEAGYLAAKSNTKALEKELEAARNSLKDTKLKAPFTGYVNRVFAEKHETIAPGQPIVSIIDVTELEVETFIPENLVAKSKDFINFSFSLTSNPGVSHVGELKEIGEKASGAGQTYPLTLKINDQGGSIKPGMSAIVEFEIDEKNRSDFFDIPIYAVQSRDGDSPLVWKIKDNKVIKADVEIVRVLNRREVRVRGNIKKGDSVVIEGAGFIKENQIVEVVGSASATNIGDEL